MKPMAESGLPAATLLVLVGGVRGLVYTALPVTTFAVTNAINGLPTAIIAAVSVASIILVWQLSRRESVRPALFGFAGISVCAAFDIASAVMATAFRARFLVQNYLHDTNQERLLAVARVAMGWPIFLLTSSLICMAIRVAIRALGRGTAQTGG